MAHTGVSLAVVDNPSLEDLAGLSRLTSISGDLQIYRLPLITSLAALSNLTAVGLNLVVGDMDGLTTLRGLSELLQSGRSLISACVCTAGKARQGMAVLVPVGGCLVVGFIQGPNCSSKQRQLCACACETYPSYAVAAMAAVMSHDNVQREVLRTLECQISSCCACSSKV